MNKATCGLARISQEITSKFQKRFKTDRSINLEPAILLSRDTNRHNDMLTIRVSIKEIFEAVTRINSLKAPDLDVYKPYSIIKRWNIIGTSICNMARSFFNHNHILKELKMTYFALIRKSKNQTVLIILGLLVYVIFL